MDKSLNIQDQNQTIKRTSGVRKKILIVILVFIFLLTVGFFAFIKITKIQEQALKDSQIVTLYGSFSDFNSESESLPEEELPKFVEGEILASFKPNTSASKIEGFLAKYNLTVKEEHKELNLNVLTTKDAKADIEKLREEIKKEPIIQESDSNYYGYGASIPNDKYFNDYKNKKYYQWNLGSAEQGGINIEPAWEIMKQANVKEKVKVAIIDSGVNRGSDLSKAEFLPGYDFVNNDSDPADDLGHGTHIAGTIAQDTDNELGVAGIASDYVKIIPIKAIDKNGSITCYNSAKGIVFAADNGAKVINLSYNFESPCFAEFLAVKYAFEKGVFIAAACGNKGANFCLYPAAFNDFVIAVGATGQDGNKTYYSNYGPDLDIMAPGGDSYQDLNKDRLPDGILQQTFLGDPKNIGLVFYQGTSMATPHVSAVAALVLAKNPKLSPVEIGNILLASAGDSKQQKRDDIMGFGKIDATAAEETDAQKAEEKVKQKEEQPGTEENNGGYFDVEDGPPSKLPKTPGDQTNKPPTITINLSKVKENSVNKLGLILDPFTKIKNTKNIEANCSNNNKKIGDFYFPMYNMASYEIIYKAPFLSEKKDITIKCNIKITAEGKIIEKSFDITIKINQAPVAKITASKTTIKKNETIRLFGTKSYDPDAEWYDKIWPRKQIIDYIWNCENEEFLFNPRGLSSAYYKNNKNQKTEDTCTLIVTDKLGKKSEPATIKITVEKENQLPIAIAKIEDSNETDNQKKYKDSIIINEGEKVKLNCRGSSALESNLPLTCEWNCNKGTVSGENKNYTFLQIYDSPSIAQNENVFCNLKVMDNKRNKSANEAVVKINIYKKEAKKDNKSPIAIISNGTTIEVNGKKIKSIDVNEGETITLDGSKSYDPEEDEESNYNLGYSWFCLEGGTLESSFTATSKFIAPTVYNANGDKINCKLKVYNISGISSEEAIIQINVKNSNNPPVAKIKAYDINGNEIPIVNKQIDGIFGEKITLDGSQSTDQDQNEDVSLGFSWVCTGAIFPTRDPIFGNENNEKMEILLMSWPGWKGFCTLFVTDGLRERDEETITINIYP